MDITGKEIEGICQIDKHIGRDAAFVALDLVLGRHVSETDLDHLYSKLREVPENECLQEYSIKYAGIKSSPRITS